MLNPSANFSMLEIAIKGPLIQGFDATTVTVCTVLYCTVQPEGGEEENHQEACVTLYSGYARRQCEFYDYSNSTIIRKGRAHDRLSTHTSTRLLRVFSYSLRYGQEFIDAPTK